MYLHVHMSQRRGAVFTPPPCSTAATHAQRCFHGLLGVEKATDTSAFASIQVQHIFLQMEPSELSLTCASFMLTPRQYAAGRLSTLAKESTAESTSEYHDRSLFFLFDALICTDRALICTVRSKPAGHALYIYIYMYPYNTCI